MGEYGIENSMCKALRQATAWKIEGLKGTRVSGAQKTRANFQRMRLKEAGAVLSRVL